MDDGRIDGGGGNSVHFVEISKFWSVFGAGDDFLGYGQFS